ncbi:hypothetical protein L227DRAFT_205736 [Lentinus tigrinus ALCF2SS1-6]|uniref:Uncharacterized protein n=1 Tax=Lentinus tigrinus ALCF2SS1-6 TaxID=1328759 RepID=A0A5C2SQ55_9APHY|nr:hypothetical protein L227DRAFT_205736 [Lentinus tigrinus ALCF2SS1-6]
MFMPADPPPASLRHSRPAPRRFSSSPTRQRPPPTPDPHRPRPPDTRGAPHVNLTSLASSPPRVRPPLAQTRICLRFSVVLTSPPTMLPVTRTSMHSNPMKRNLAASPRELDAKLELLQQLGYEDRFYLDDDASIPDEKAPYLDHDTDRWIQTEYNWALGEAAESAASIPDLFDVEEDEEACLPYVYDPTLFAARQSLPSSPRARSQSLSQGNVDKFACFPFCARPPRRRGRSRRRTRRVATC